MSNTPYPNVPDVPGVPPVPRSDDDPIDPTEQIDSGASDVVLNNTQNNSPWGIFDGNGNSITDNALLIQPTSVLSTHGVDYSKDTKISDFPVERGGFANYNKVEVPGIAKVTLCFSGTKEERAQFLFILDTLVKTTELFNVVTPEVTYNNYNVESYKYQRSSERGVTLLTVELSLREVREVEAKFTVSKINKPKDPSASNQVDNGKVQAKTPEKSTLKVTSDKLGL